jgi:hypothetical protein
VRVAVLDDRASAHWVWRQLGFGFRLGLGFGFRLGFGLGG